MTQQNKDHIASLLAVLLGLLSINEGGSVLLGLSTRTYTTLPWLVWYNVVIGFLSVLCGRGLWVKRTWADKLADTIVTLHGLVLMILIVLFSFHETVAMTSIMAMLFRTLVWVGIIVLTRKIKDKASRRTVGHCATSKSDGEKLSLLQEDFS